MTAQFKKAIKLTIKRCWTPAVQRRVLTFALGFLTAIVCTRVSDNRKTLAAAEAVLVAQQQIVAATPQPVIGKADVPADNSRNQMVADAKAIARVLYGVKDYKLPDNAKLAITEVILNRVDCTYGEFGDDIQAVCNKDQQWQGYKKDGDFLKDDYDLVLDRLRDTSGARSIPEGCYYLVCEHGQVTVRTEWQGGNAWTVK